MLQKSKLEMFQKLWRGRYFDENLTYSQAVYHFFEIGESDDPTVQGIYEHTYQQILDWLADNRIDPNS